MNYQFLAIEKKWQQYWDQHRCFRADDQDRQKPKYYVLDMFPYPSGSGLHVGHPEGYTATDIIARYKRMCGFNVLHPMGWDSFGLPAENYAIKTGTHPEQITRQNIQNFKRQLQMLGFSYDWEREIATSDVDYYRWTQWIFVQLYNKGLAYEDEILVNWCPELKTVLANEEVVDGRSEIGNHPVIRRPMKQWMLKITDYAERLLADLEGLDWPENIKEMQRHWIGKSVGASVLFSEMASGKHIECFTTRPDTLFGATYLVLAPEHPLVPVITSPEQRGVVQTYLQQCQLKSDLERTDLNKDKTGVFSGAYGINPVNQAKIPIWIADYVLMHYGTGAIMAVPAHDQRDFEFARKYQLPIVPVLAGGEVEIAAFVGDGTHINSAFLNGMDTATAIKTMIEFLTTQHCGQAQVNYKLRDWLFSRQRYWGEPFPLLKYADGSVRCLDPDELPVALPPVEKYGPSGTGESPLAAITDWVEVFDHKRQQPARRETHTMPQWAGSCWYYLRFIDPQNAKAPWDSGKEKYWMPVDLYVGGVEHAVLHLLYARFWHKVLYDLGLVSTVEPFAKLVNQGLILGEDGEKMSKSRGNVVNPDEIVAEFGADSLRLYEMFMGPLERVKPWSTNGVKGVFNFLQRSYRYFLGAGNVGKHQEEHPEILKMLHKTIKKVTQDLEQLRFNTAISQLMILLNTCHRQPSVTQQTAEQFTLLLAPFAPHLAEEIWQQLGHPTSLTTVSWPQYSEELAKDDVLTMAVQINGKTRLTLELPAELQGPEVVAKIKSDERVQKYLAGQQLVKEIYVPGKICNFVCRPVYS